jgi:uncharacterized membrane protein (DUF485 family)
VNEKMDLHSEAFLQMLMRRQLTLSLSLASVFVVIIFGVPLLNMYMPDVMNAPMLGLTVSWFLLGLAVFPVLIVLAGIFVSRSNAFEDEAVGLVDPSTMPKRAQDATDMPATGPRPVTT